MPKNKILEMSADELYEVDGVVFDADSYARYLQHCGTAEPAPPGRSLERAAPDAPPAGGSPAANPPADGSPAGNPPADGSPAGNPPADGSPADNPPADGAEAAAAPSPTFYTDPRHVGWYPEQDGQPAVPIMSGAVAPAVPHAEPAPAYFIAPVQTVEVIRIPIGRVQRLVYGGGSGSGSYQTSFTTSFWTSYRFGSGSGSFFSSGSCIFAVGGYGLELI